MRIRNRESRQKRLLERRKQRKSVTLKPTLEPVQLFHFLPAWRDPFEPGSVFKPLSSGLIHSHQIHHFWPCLIHVSPCIFLVSARESQLPIRESGATDTAAVNRLELGSLADLNVAAVSFIG